MMAGGPLKANRTYTLQFRLHELARPVKKRGGRDGLPSLIEDRELAPGVLGRLEKGLGHLGQAHELGAVAVFVFAPC